MAVTKPAATALTQKAVFRVSFLLLCAVVIFGLVRTLLVPVSFGEYGRYRGDSITEVASREVNFAGGGNDTCGKCHQDHYLALTQAEHKQLNCQTCHGPGAKHAAKAGSQSLAVKGDAGLCGACHQETTGRVTQQIATVKLQMHSGGVECGRCHDPHRPWAKLGGRKP